MGDGNEAWTFIVASEEGMQMTPEIIHLRIAFRGPAVYRGDREIGKGLLGTDVVSAVASVPDAVDAARKARTTLRVGAALFGVAPLMVLASGWLIGHSLNHAIPTDQQIAFQRLSVGCSFAFGALVLAGVLTLRYGFNAAARAVNGYNTRLLDLHRL
jgi:hypothetical protein